jgi:hypothetical protein
MSMLISLSSAALLATNAAAVDTQVQDIYSALELEPVAHYQPGIHQLEVVAQIGSGNPGGGRSGSAGGSGGGRKGNGR